MIAGYITTAEAGVQLGVGDSRVRQLIIAGRLEATNIGGVLFIKQTQVDRYKRTKRANGNAKRKAA